MPWVDLHSKDDYASIYYTTNTISHYVTGFDPNKPTIVVLHPIFLDSSWIDVQLVDSRLNKSYNVFALDMRSCGKSKCRPSGKHDSWVDAADLAFCYQKLHLPPSHILSLEGSSIYCALRFAVLFPEFCLSLTLVNVPAPVELKWIYKNIDEMIHTFCFADDAGTFEQAVFDFIEFMFGPGSEPDLVDEVLPFHRIPVNLSDTSKLISFWEKNLPPSKRHRIAETASSYINRTPMRPEECALIKQPVLIIQGEKNQLCPLKYAERLVSQLTNVEDGAVLYEVKGGASMISVVPGYASIVNNVFLKFLSRLPHHRSEIVPPQTSIKERMRAALKKLSEIKGDPETAFLDPLCPLSFSCLLPEVVQSQSELLMHYEREASRAFTPDLAISKIYLRKEKKMSEKDRLETFASSYAESTRDCEPPERFLPPESQQSHFDTSILKAVNAGQKYNLKGLKSKIGNTPLQRTA